MIVFSAIVQLLYAFDVHDAYLFHIISRIAKWLLVIGISGMGFYNSPPLSQAAEGRKFEASHKAIVVSMFAYFIAGWFSFIAAVATLMEMDPIHPEPDKLSDVGDLEASLLIVDEVFNFLEVVLQALFILYVSKFDNFNKNPSCLFYICSLMVTNICLWAVQSFGEVKNIYKMSPIEYNFFGITWVTVVILTFPVTLFFRVTCAVHCWELLAHNGYFSFFRNIFCET